MDNDHWNLPRSKWARPYHVDTLQKYAEHVRNGRLWHQLDTLEGKLLGCWCHDEDRCHGSVLADLLEEKKVKELDDKLKKCGLRVDPTDLQELRHEYDWYRVHQRFFVYATRLDRTNIFYFQPAVYEALQTLWGTSGPKAWRAYTNDNRCFWIVGLCDDPQPLGPFWDEEASYDNLLHSPLADSTDMPHVCDLFAFARMVQPRIDAQKDAFKKAFQAAMAYHTKHRLLVREVGKLTHIDMDDHDLTKSRLVQVALAYAWHWPEHLAPKDEALDKAAKLAIRGGHCELEDHHPEYEDVNFGRVDPEKLLVDRVSVHVQKDTMDRENGWAVDPMYIPDKYLNVWDALKKEHADKNLYVDALWKVNKELTPRLSRGVATRAFLRALRRDPGTPGVRYENDSDPEILDPPEITYSRKHTVTPCRRRPQSSQPCVDSSHEGSPY